MMKQEIYSSNVDCLLNQVKVHDGYAYVAGPSKLTIVDVHNPDFLNPVNTLDIDTGSR